MIEPWPAEYMQPQGMSGASHLYGTPGHYTLMRDRKIKEAADNLIKMTELIEADIKKASHGLLEMRDLLKSIE